MKRRLSILLCFLMVFTTVFAIAPTETQAATTTYTFYGIGTNDNTVKVVKGAKNLYAGDLIYGYSYSGTSSKYLGYLSSLKNVTYKSSKTSVASINKSTGKITPKKAGTTKITAKYKSKTVSFNLTVLKSQSALYKDMATANSYNSESYYKNMTTVADKEGKAFLKLVENDLKVDASNRYDCLAAYKKGSLSYNGSMYYNKYNSSTQKYEYGYYLYSPSCIRAYRLRDKIANYASEYNPFSTYSSKHFEIKSIRGEAKSKTITVTLKDKVTKNQIYGATYVYSWDTDVKQSNTYSFPILVQNTSSGHKYYATATIKKGSNQMKITLKNTTLTKDVTYKLVAATPSTYAYDVTLGNWLDDVIYDDGAYMNNINTFKAK